MDINNFHSEESLRIAAGLYDINNIYIKHKGSERILANSNYGYLLGQGSYRTLKSKTLLHLFWD
jgi:hypothetical protein